MQTHEKEPLNLSEESPASSPASLWDAARSDRSRLEGAAEPHWLVYELLAAASVCVFAAPPGSYKWWLAWDIARHVANGSEWCGLTTHQSRVLYLDLDNPETVSRERVRMWPAAPAAVAYLGNWGDDRDRGLAHLERMPPVREQRAASRSGIAAVDDFYWNLSSAPLWELARRYRPLIIFDSLIRFHTESENDNRGMELVMACFRRLTEAGATCLVLHHQHQGEPRPRGAGEIEAAADTVFMVHRSGRHATLNGRKWRHVEEKSYTVEWTTAGFRQSKPPPESAPHRGRRKKAAASKDQGVLF
jgi:RecA-family ATPase